MSNDHGLGDTSNETNRQPAFVGNLALVMGALAILLGLLSILGALTHAAVY